MDHEVLLPCFENSDLNQSSSSVGADQHGEVRLIGLCDPSRRVLDGMANIVIGDAVLSGTWQDLHTDNSSCRCACSQPSLRRYGETGAPSRHRPRVSASSHGQRDRRGRTQLESQGRVRPGWSHRRRRPQDRRAGRTLRFHCSKGCQCDPVPPKTPRFSWASTGRRPARRTSQRSRWSSSDRRAMSIK